MDIQAQKDIYIKVLIERIVSKINEYPESNALVSVVLTGSLGRDEGTFHIDTESSKLILDSDVELALVYKFGKKSLAEKIKRNLISDFSEDMNPMAISESRVKNGYNFNYSVRRPKRSSIFMYDFYKGSKTIWGEDLLDREVAPYDKYEAKRIVANRIGELVCVEQANDKDSPVVNQWKAKLLLALGSAYCILTDAYDSKYESQRNYILANKESVDKLFCKGFSEDYEKAYLFLRKGHPYSNIDRNKLILYTKGAHFLFYNCEVEEPKINSLSRNVKYWRACLKSRCGINPLICEIVIISNLINYFSYDEEQELIAAAKAWKEILY